MKRILFIACVLGLIFFVRSQSGHNFINPENNPEQQTDAQEGTQTQAEGETNAEPKTETEKQEIETRSTNTTPEAQTQKSTPANKKTNAAVQVSVQKDATDTTEQEKNNTQKIDSETEVTQNTSSFTTTLYVREWTLIPMHTSIPAGTTKFTLVNNGHFLHTLQLKDENGNSMTPKINNPARRQTHFSVDLPAGEYTMQATSVVDQSKIMEYTLQVQ
jgi:cytoskeletal protein RodZ